MDRVVHGDFTGDLAPGVRGERDRAIVGSRPPGRARTKNNDSIRWGLGSGREIARLRMSDLVVHTWDLARALGLPEALDRDLVMESLAVFEVVGETFSTAGFFGPGPSGSVKGRMLLTN